MRLLRYMMACAAVAVGVQAGAKDKVTVSVTPVERDGDAAHGGVIYTLPQTVLQIRLTARVVVSTAGPFYKYATRHLNMTDVVTANAMDWKVIGAEVLTAGRADNSKRYKVTASAVEGMPNIVTAEDGRLLGVNTACAGGRCERMAREEQVRVAYADLQKVHLPGSVLMRTSTASMAEECAQSIYALREARVDLISGSKDSQVADAGAMQTALARIDREEQELVELFVGVRDTLIVSKVVEVVPDYNGESSVVPIRFSETHGFVDALDLSGKPIYVDMEFDDSSKVNEYPEGSKQRRASPVSGFRYYLPCNLMVKVLDRNILLTETRVRCTQNAQLMSLPAEYLRECEIEIDGANGSLKSLRRKATDESTKKGK